MTEQSKPAGVPGSVEAEAAKSVSPGQHGAGGSGHPSGAEGVRQANQPGPPNPPANQPDANADKQRAEQIQQQQRQQTDAALATARAKLQQPVRVVGSEAGGPFNITGSGFGTTKGSITIGGMPVTEITRWDDQNIRGNLPAGVKGEVIVYSANGQQRGTFPHVEEKK